MSSHDSRGFTLLELLIALVLLGILTGALYGSYFAVTRARDRAAEGMEARRELGATLDLLRREFASAVFASGDKRLRFVVEDRDNFGKPASSLELTTLAPPSGQPRKESGIINVQYRIAERDKRLVLTRREQDQLFDSVTVPVYPQMERISAFLVECYDGSKWLRSWDTAINPGLPKRLRITVQVEEQGKTVEFTVYSKPEAPGQ
ncbi:MAG: type II secretion system protein GspJ [Deltaproteobacteria bacterium]|nr:type II secretion system protein GspJ [Deltaproteobacteria bacterium]